MLAYNGSIPGPLLKAPQGAEVTINFTNNTDIDTTLHSHGLRLDNKYDGTPGLTQEAIGPRGTFTYKPGELLKAELPVRSGDQRYSLLWDEGTTRTFQFDRLSHEPRLGAAEAATGVTLVPVAGSRIPRAPLLLPELKR